MNFKGTKETDPRRFGNDQMEIVKERKEPVTTGEVVPEGWIYIYSIITTGSAMQ